MIHDLGKVSLPTDIVSRPGKLFEMEFNLIKTIQMSDMKY